MMRVHHLNCVTMCPPGGRLMDGRPLARGSAKLACHCLLVETGDRLVLVDTGFGLADVRHPFPRLHPLFLEVLARPDLREEDTAVRQLEQLGFAADDVTDIVLTHLDFDHAGGLDDFPRARVHLTAVEEKSASAQPTPLDKMRFRRQQWSSRGRWHTYGIGGERWFGFDAVRGLEGLPPEILLVPLAGHTLGHAGVALRTDGRWLLHAGDAYFFHREMARQPYCPPGLRFYQWFMEKDRSLRLANQRRLRALVATHGGEVRVFCAHDEVELAELLKEQHKVRERERPPAPEARPEL